MENEIHLRVYLDVLLRRWKWVIGVTLVTASITGVVSLTTPPVYEATATLAVLQNHEAVPVSPSMHLVMLQTSDTATQALRLLGQDSAGENANTLARRVRVVADAQDKMLLRVTAQAATSQQATSLANAWVDAGVDAINQIQNQILSQSTQISLQDVERSAKDLLAAEENLQRARSNFLIDSLAQQLARIEQIHSGLYAERENVRSTLAQAQALKWQVQQGAISLSPEMLLNLQTTSTSSSNRFLIQSAQPVDLTKQRQLDQLDAIIAALNGKQQILLASLDSVTVQTSALQQQLGEKQATLIEPTQARDIARANYDSAITQLHDARARFISQQNPARVIARAVVPDSPIAPKIPRDIAITGVVGMLVAVLGVIVVELFAGPRASDVP